MFTKTLLLALLNAGLLAEAGVIEPRQFGRFRGGGNNGGNNDNDNNNGGNADGQDGSQCLLEDAIQSASASTGQDPENPNPEQADSATDNANFINFCSGKTLTNGLQIREGSCNGIVMGDIPSTERMVAANIVFPQHDDVVPAFEDFDFQVQIANLQAGSFTNPQETYYAAPQQLNNNGQIIGHVHVTVQDLGNSMNPGEPLDPTRFVFFKGINDAGDGNGNLRATVAGGLPAGNYRVCTMSSGSNHQPVLMPVAQRGSQEDCQKFVVEDGNGGNGNNDEEDEDEDADNDDGGNGGGNGGNGNNNNGGGNGGNGGNGNNNGGNGNGNVDDTDGGDIDDDDEDFGAAGGANNADVGGNGGEDPTPSEDPIIFPTGGAGGAADPVADPPLFPNATTAAEDDTGEEIPPEDAVADPEKPEEAVGGITPPPVEEDPKTDSRRPFKVGGRRFGDRRSAVRAACGNQNTRCCSAARNGFRGLSTARCNRQVGRCLGKLGGF